MDKKKTLLKYVDEKYFDDPQVLRGTICQMHKRLRRAINDRQWTEITQDMFMKLTPPYHKRKVRSRENLEHGHRFYYVFDSVRFLETRCYLTNTSHYYVQDINL